jgi:hypothetical protein
MTRAKYIKQPEESMAHEDVAGHLHDLRTRR